MGCGCGCKGCQAKAKAEAEAAKQAVFEPRFGEIVSAELSNPGKIGIDTGYTFRSPKTGGLVRVIAKSGESRADAIQRVKDRHAK